MTAPSIVQDCQTASRSDAWVQKQAKLVSDGRKGCKQIVLTCQEFGVCSNNARRQCQCGSARSSFQPCVGSRQIHLAGETLSDPETFQNTHFVSFSFAQSLASLLGLILVRRPYLAQFPFILQEWKKACVNWLPCSLVRPGAGATVDSFTLKT